MNLINKIRGLVQTLREKGFFYIVSSSAVNQVIGFASSIIIVRLLTKSDFGVYSYALNVISFFLLFNGLGTGAGMLQFGSETEETGMRNAVFRYGLRIGLLFNTILALAILLYGLFLPFAIEAARPVFVAMALYPLALFVSSSIFTYFRTTLENKKFSLCNTITAALVLVFSVVGAICCSSMGIVMFRYIAYAIAIVIGWFLLKESRQGIIRGYDLGRKIKQEFMKYSISASFANAIAQMVFLIDILLIGVILGDQLVVASYKTASLIPFALSFIPSSVMVFVYPYFAKNKENKEWIKRKYLTLTGLLIVGNAGISVTLFIFAPSILEIVFGTQYLDALVPFRILAVGYFIMGSFRIPIGNILAMMRKIKFALYLSIVTGILNIVLDVILIGKYQAIGAALSTVGVFLFTSLLGGIYFWKVLRDGKQERLRNTGQE